MSALTIISAVQAAFALVRRAAPVVERLRSDPNESTITEAISVANELAQAGRDLHQRLRGEGLTPDQMKEVAASIAEGERLYGEKFDNVRKEPL